MCVRFALRRVVPALVDLIDMELSLERSKLQAQRGSLAVLHTLSSDMDHYQSQLAWHLKDLALRGPEKMPASLHARIEDFIASRDDISAFVSDLEKSETIRSVLREEIELYMPGKFQQVTTNNSKMCLVGVTSFKAVYDPRVKISLKSYSIFENSNAIVAYAPFYVYQFMKELKRQGVIPRTVQIKSAPGPKDEELRYAAARLWDPYGSGPLADLRTALKSAKAL